MAIYTKVTDASGVDTYVEVDETAIIRESEDYKETQRKLQKANSEAKTYRLAEKARLAAAQASLDEAGDEHSDDTNIETKPVKSAKASPAPTDVETLIAQVEARLEEKAKKAIETNKTVSDLMTQHNVPAEFLEVVRNSADPKLAAETLGRNLLKFAPASGGTEVRGTAMEAEIVKAEQALGFKRAVR